MAGETTDHIFLWLPCMFLSYRPWCVCNAVLINCMPYIPCMIGALM